MRAALAMLVLVSLSQTAWSSPSTFFPTLRECEEGSDFIRNAARSRDNGYSENKIVGRFDEDVVVLSGMAPEKRWFIRSPGATVFLRKALVAVFQMPKRPGDQASTFLAACKEQVMTPDDL